METMNIHYTTVRIRMKENQKVQMGQKLRKLLKEKSKKNEEKKTHTASGNTI